MDLSPNPHDINLGIEFLIIEVRNKKGSTYLSSVIKDGGPELSWSMEGRQQSRWSSQNQAVRVTKAVIG